MTWLIDSYQYSLFDPLSPQDNLIWMSQLNPQNRCCKLLNPRYHIIIPNSQHLGLPGSTNSKEKCSDPFPHPTHWVTAYKPMTAVIQSWQLPNPVFGTMQPSPTFHSDIKSPLLRTLLMSCETKTEIVISPTKSIQPAPWRTLWQSATKQVAP